MICIVIIRSISQVVVVKKCKKILNKNEFMDVNRGHQKRLKKYSRTSFAMGIFTLTFTVMVVI